jgi:hypothetical protein
MLGLFDRPADERAFGALLKSPAIPGLTETLTDLRPAEWQTILANRQFAAWSKMPPLKKTPQYFAVVDANGVTVAPTVSTRKEAEQVPGTSNKSLRVIQVTGPMKTGHQIGHGDMVVELCGGLPPRGR